MTATSDYPSRIGGYRVLGELGRGGMGTVYAAEDPRLEREIALKVFSPQIIIGPVALNRMRQTVEILASLNHPNIAMVYSVEEAEGRVFHTMERISGTTLSECVRQRPLGLEGLLPVCRQIALALQAAHEKGILHLDLKPDNVMVTMERQVKVLDFGMADARLPAEGYGTPGYMSPDHLRGNALDARADVWAFGCVLYECLAGRHVFPGATPAERVEATLSREPDWTALPQELSPQIRRLLGTCLEKDGQRQLGDMSAVRKELEEEVARLDASPFGTPLGDLETNPSVPRPSDRLIGRTLELDRLQTDGWQAGLVTVTGAGGCGKTRLASEGALRSFTEFPDGIWWVDLAPVVDPARVSSVIASSIGAGERPREEVGPTLASHLQAKRALLVLDNCEHLRSPVAGLVGGLLANAPTLTIWCTSREPLEVPGERTLRVTSLRCPAEDEVVTIENWNQYEAVSLFMDRVRRLRRDAALLPDNPPAIAETCRRFDGIPLALELAAAHHHDATAPNLTALVDGPVVPSSGAENSVHASLFALVDWSHGLLTERERLLFRRLAVFSGGWTLRAAEAVTAAEPLPEWEILDLLSRLVRKSMVEVVPGVASATAHTRYRFLETIRQFAWQRIEESGELDSLRSRHRQFFRELIATAESRPRGEAVPVQDQERENIDAAIDAAVRTGEIEDAVLLCNAMGTFWCTRSQFSRGRILVDRLLALPESAAPTRAWALLHQLGGRLAYFQGDHQAAERSFNQSIDVSRLLGARRDLSDALRSRGGLHTVRGRYAEARRDYEQALEFCEGSGALRSAILVDIGRVLLATGEPALGEMRFREALEQSRQTDDLSSLATSLEALGYARICQGDLEEAQALLEESLAAAREVGNLSTEATILNMLGRTFYDRGEHRTARGFYEQSLALRRQLGDKWGTGISLHSLGMVALQRGEYESSRELLLESLVIFEDLADVPNIAGALGNLGVVAGYLGRLDEAVGYFNDAIRLYRKANSLIVLPLTIDGFVAHAAAFLSPSRTARILAGNEALRERLSVKPTPAGESNRLRAQETLRRALSPEEYAQEEQRGRALSTDELIRLILNEDPSPE